MERARAEQRAEAKARERTGSAGGDNENVINMPRRERETAAGAPAATVPVAEAEERIRTFANADPAAVPGLLEILGFDDAFAPDGFLKGAKQAYEMIVTAFAEGNRKTLKDLLSREVFEGFSAAIAKRESRGEIMDQSFVGISKADITEAGVKNGNASITGAVCEPAYLRHPRSRRYSGRRRSAAHQGSDRRLDIQPRPLLGTRASEPELATDRDPGRKLSRGGRVRDVRRWGRQPRA